MLKSQICLISISTNFEDFNQCLAFDHMGPHSIQEDQLHKNSELPFQQYVLNFKIEQLLHQRDQYTPVEHTQVMLVQGLSNHLKFLGYF